MMVDFRVLLITDDSGRTAESLHGILRTACEAGIRAVQLREKSRDARNLHDLARSTRDVVNAAGGRLLVNDRVDIALSVEADGVHCPQNGFPAACARRLLGKEGLVGMSAHSTEAMRCAETQGVDFILFGPVFDTPSKAAFGKPQGLEALREACGAVEIPVFAVGGITPYNAPDCIDVGAAGVAVISSIMQSNRVAETVSRYEAVLGAL